LWPVAAGASGLRERRTTIYRTVLSDGRRGQRSRES